METLEGLKLSELIDRSIRFLRKEAQPAVRQRASEIVQDTLVTLGMFARDMERTEALHADEPARQTIERALAAERLYGRLVDPPHGDNVEILQARGIGRVLLLESRRS